MGWYNIGFWYWILLVWYLGVCCPYRTGLVVWIMWAWFGCVSGLVCWYFSDCCVGTGGLRLIVAVGSASGFDRRVLRRWFGGGCLDLVDVD